MSSTNIDTLCLGDFVGPIELNHKTNIEQDDKTNKTKVKVIMNRVKAFMKPKFLMN